MQIPTFQTEESKNYISLPPRSSLYSLAPVGVGTPYCESLSSYICRLAAEHSVSSRSLFRFAAKKAGHKHVKLSIDYNLRTCNGLSLYSKIFSRSFKELTGQQNIAGLSMLPWAPIFDSAGHGLLCKEKRWCPLCLDESNNNSATIFEPLLWSIGAVERCLIHHIPLVNKCVHCHSKQVFFPGRTKIGFCCNCSRPLGTAINSNNLTDKKNQKILAFDRNSWVGHAVGEMIAAADKLPSDFSSHYLTRALKALPCKSRFRGTTQMCKDLNIKNTTYYQWSSGRYLPRFDVFLDFCYRINISPVALLLLNQPFPKSINSNLPKIIWSQRPQYQERKQAHF